MDRFFKYYIIDIVFIDTATATVNNNDDMHNDHNDDDDKYDDY
jgi:hypothetical protein